MRRRNSSPGKVDYSPGRGAKLLFYLGGIISLIWFLIRVIPRPSRAAYPCQRVAFPLAAAFVIWLTGIMSSSFIYVRAKMNWRSSRYKAGALLCLLAISVFLVTTTPFRYTPAMAIVYDIKDSLLGSSIPSLQNTGMQDSTTVEPASFVGVSKSEQSSAEDIDSFEILTMVREAIEKSGGLESVVSDGDTVVIKPNLISFTDFTASQDTLVPEVNGIATDYRVIQAVVDVVREVNPTGRIYVMEGSGVGITSENMVIVNWDQITGTDGLLCLEDISGDWFDTTSVFLQGVSLPPGKALYNGANNRYWLNKLYYEADVLISVPVLKNHHAAGTTGGVKNVGIGATPPTIYGLGPEYQYPYERSQSIDHGFYGSWRNNLHYWIHDFYMCRPVDFVVIDGLQGIQNGPLCNGTQEISEEQKNMRLILASSDPIAVDAVGALLTGHDPLLIQHLVTLHNDSLGCCDPRLIRVNGIKVGDEKQDFEITESGRRSKYSDFDGPTFSVDNFEVLGDELHFRMTVDEEVSKVEVTIDGSYLNQIVIGSFEDCSVDLDTFVVDENTEVYVYAYDRYLNYNRLLVQPGTSIPDNNDPEHMPTNTGFALHDNYPNPFNPRTTIRYTIPEEAVVTLEVYDLLGRKIETLVHERRAAGNHECVWNRKNAASGVYFYRLSAGEFVETRKMTLLK